MLKSLFTRGAMLAVCAVSLLSPALADDAIKIGSFLSATGPASFLGDPELKTLQLYIDKLNAEGGLLGKKVELIHYDDAGDAEKARTFVKRLLDNDKVSLIIGGTTTGTTMAAIPLVERAKIPFISLAGGIDIIDPVKKWVFKTPQTDRMAAAKIMEDMKKRGYTKIALLSETSGFGRSGREQTLKVAPEYGIDIVLDETYGPKDTDMTAQLTKIKNTEGVQAVFVFGFGQGPAIVTKNYAQLGITLPLYQSHGVASNSYIDLAGDAAQGVLISASALLITDDLPADDVQKTVLVNYKKDYETAFKAPVSTFGAYAYDGLMLAVNAIKKAGSTDPSKVRDAIEQTEGYVGATGVVNMSPKDHMGLDLTAFRILEIKDGGWVLIQ
ncbi:MAG: ABC transporter substrate-binding protein [Gammaproteobacteria bacterium]|nr:ABC transporter substrate-binding protein [Gammaproteobacteria bacterium]MCP5423521.1 ABC transporter substrate-binding protein [Gammaproteobacteria bacterium]